MSGLVTAMQPQVQSCSRFYSRFPPHQRISKQQMSLQNSAGQKRVAGVLDFAQGFFWVLDGSANRRAAAENPQDPAHGEADGKPIAESIIFGFPQDHTMFF